jgi:hypothetical protein
MRVGQTIQNIHTNGIYTLIDIKSVDMGRGIVKAVYTVSNEAFEVIGFNADYLPNWQVINEEE